MKRPDRHAPRQPGRGVAALTVVMVLFFVMALVAAYTNRNLLFEQRISANSYRATRALEAAEAGVEWTLAMLNSGRIDARCNRPDPADAAGLTDFRSRYLVPSASKYGEGAFDLPWGQTANRAYPACLIVRGVPRCICPAMGEAPADIAPPSDGVASGFRITFRLFNDNTPRGGAIQFVSRGCASPGEGASSCFAQTDARPSVDGTTSMITTVGLVRALPKAPVATLTAGDTVTALLPARLEIGNSESTSGITVHAGTAASASAPASMLDGSLFESAAGSLENGRINGDPALETLWKLGQDAWFRSQFLLDPASYQRQPATAWLDCAAGCNGAQIAAKLALNPRNPLWADGDVNLDRDGPLGTPDDPVMLIVKGKLTVSAAVQATGFVHANAIVWPSPSATWEGALVAFSTFAATGNGVATLRYNKRALDTIRLQYGSFVRAPGGSNLF